MAIRQVKQPFEGVPEQLTDGSRLVGMVSGGTPVYHDPDAAVFRDADGSTEENRQSTEPDCCRHTIDSEESVADAITAVERHSGWAVLSEYGLEHLSDE